MYSHIDSTFRLTALVALFSKHLLAHSNEAHVLQLLNVHISTFLDGPLFRPPMYPPSPLAPNLTQDLLGLESLVFSSWLVVFWVLGSPP